MSKTVLLLCIFTPVLLLAEEINILPAQDAYTCDCAPNSTNPNGGFTYLYQGWVDGTFENHGIFAHVQDTPGTSCPGFFSSNYSIADRKPYLLVTGTGLSFEQVTWGNVKVREKL